MVEDLGIGSLVLALKIALKLADEQRLLVSFARGVRAGTAPHLCNLSAG